MKVVCKFNDPSNIPRGIPNDFDYGLEINKEYLIMGVLTFKKSNNLYYLVDENGRPSWFPFQIFEFLENILPQNWFLKINIGNDHVDYQNLFGFNELCNNEDYFNQLLERDEKAMSIYFKRKSEIEKELA